MKWGFRDRCELEEWEIQEGGGTMWKVEGKKGGDPGSLGQDGKNAGRGRPEHLA